ncbi:MAG: homocysteine S-methyltransferase family protein [Lachnospiraceae bacterium]|nr:homocysteine S-methyltransferase family protein [Lachnospiraceae bacterium]
MTSPVLSELSRRRLFIDGACGTYLQEKGLAPGRSPETWNSERPEEVLAMHRAYLDAGCDILTANTFGAAGSDDPESAAAAGVRLARRAADEAAPARAAAGKAGPFAALDLGPTGRLLAPMGDLPFEEAVSLYARTVRAGAAAGADLVLIETMGDTGELRAAVLAAKENCDLPVFASVTFDESGRLLTGADPAAVAALLTGLRVDAIGINCSLGPEQLLPIAQKLLACTDLPVLVSPNAGLPRTQGGLVRYDVGPEGFAACGARFAAAGVRLLGGCCGTTPAHIRALIETCRDLPFAAPAPGAAAARPGTVSENADVSAASRGAVISSFCRTVTFGDEPVLIGERINPTGKKRFQQALREHDIDYLVREGLAQEDAGAQVLDVNVGLPGIDEPAMMEEAVRALQAVTPLPLQLDTSDPRALERGLRAYTGKALINSVNGKEESMEAVFPLAAKYGGAVVALTLDESGIPDTADGRIAIARKILERAASYGIPAHDILIDSLAMAVSADSRAALVTLETLRRVREELGCGTVLGVSNVSFGLPRRPAIGAVYLTMALQNGLCAAIMNPMSPEMMTAWHAFRTLAGLDDRCAAYIDYCASLPEAVSAAPSSPAAAPSAKASAAGPLTLGAAVQRGLASDAARLCREALDAGEDPLALIDGQLVPALGVVGEGFEKKTVFLPGLLMSAEAAAAAFEEIKQKLLAAGQERAARGRIVLATVRGDIHDIGKNIVKVLLENYGFEVLDLGKDVAPETVSDAVTANGIRLVGLSALMTTTVPSMEATIALLRKTAPDCRVMVGGAVMTQEYADRIGADFYGKDAMASVRYAEQLFSAQE